MNWLETSVRDHYTADMPLPFIYPSPGGQILFEWKISTKSVSLEIDLSDRSGYWHVFDLITKTDSDEDLDLGAADGWNRLAERLAAIHGGGASD